MVTSFFGKKWYFWVGIGTEKSGLPDLFITGGGQALILAPAFVYCQTDYTLDVTPYIDKACSAVSPIAIETV
ncbi:MAG: hypothetical protein ABFD08_11100 [Syntrophomonas sp.]